MYLAAAEESIAVSRGTAQKLYRRDIPYVLLMHVSAMSARMMPKVTSPGRLTAMPSAMVVVWCTGSMPPFSS